MIEINIDQELVRRLIDTQFPSLRHLEIQPVKIGGWDNRTFHLGDEMLVRMPSSEDYSLQVEKEQTWLPKLAPFLPLQIPVPIALGQPQESYPWNWSIYRWLPGETASIATINNLTQFAISLAQFFNALRSIDTIGGPIAGFHSFYRGGSLKTYDAETHKAILILKDQIDTKSVTEIWESALTTEWQQPPVWVHGDISVGNLLVNEGQLSAVIDFGQLAIGDPACDLVIAWTLFKGESREIFCKTLNLDSATWARARGWTLWKALISIANNTNLNNQAVKQHLSVIDELLMNHRKIA